MRHVLFFMLIAVAIAGCGSSAAAPPATSAPIANVVDETAPPAPTQTLQRVVATPAPSATPEPARATEVVVEPAPSATSEPTVAPISTPAPTVAPSTTPVPEPSVAPEPTVVPVQAAAPAPAAGAENRIVIGAIGLDQPLVSVGLDGNNVPIVPNHNVGWYNLSARPGQGDNIVLWGHVLRFKNAPNVPAPFARMKELAPGTQIVLYDAQGTPRTYTVTRQVWATPDQVEYILPQGREMVTMVSCIGDKVIVSNSVELTHRLITIAEPVS